MRNFRVTLHDGVRHIVRANDFHRPCESINGRWEFLDADDKVLWSWDAEEVSSVVEGITLMEVARVI